MWPYWILFIIPAFQAVAKESQVVTLTPQVRWTQLWRLVFILFILTIGLRHEVGGDWASYLASVEFMENLTLVEAITRKRADPSDSLLSWIAMNSGFGVYLVNSIYGTIFTWGLLTFCKKQPKPWLALTVAIPYLLTVVAMGYSRQGVAIGLVMLGLAAFEDKNLSKFIVWTALAATFHKSAVIMFPLAVLAGTERRWVTQLWILVSALLLFVLLSQEYIDSVVSGYITEQYDSAGAAIRIAMNALPAMIFLVLRKRFELKSTQQKFWSLMAWSALLFVILLYVSPSSTAVDRVALYWIPLQLFVWSRIPIAIGGSGKNRASWTYAVVAYCASVHFVWLFFAVHSVYWIPYQFYPWVWIWN